MKHDTRINTLTNRDVEQMSVLRRAKSMAISLYLGVRADRDFLTVANSLFSEERRRIGNKLSPEDKKNIDAVFNEMEKRLRIIKLPDRTRSFIMFFDKKGGLRFYRVPVYIPPQLVVERDFYIHPFIKNLQKHLHYAVVFLARDRARIFNFFWGEVEDETEEIRSDVPQRMNAGRAAWKGLSENRILNHIEVHIDRHLKKVSGRVEKYMDKNEIPYLIIGSRRELVERFKEHLPVRVRSKVIGSYLVRTDQSIKRISEKSREVIDRFELERENSLIEKIFAGSSKKKKEAALGIDAVLNKLDKYQIHNLIIGKKYVEGGYLCPDDHSVYPRKTDCRRCESGMDRVSDMADELIETAIAKRIKITHLLHDHEEFDQFGIGAILK